MLVLSRKLGESLYIGDAVCITVYDRLRYHVMLGVLAPATMPLHIGGRAVRPARLPTGEHFYAVTVLSGDGLHIGEAQVHAMFPPMCLATSAIRRRPVRIGVHAPRAVPVHREEIYRRIRAQAGDPLPAITKAEWLRQAHRAVSCRAAA